MIDTRIGMKLPNPMMQRSALRSAADHPNRPLSRPPIRSLMARHRFSPHQRLAIWTTHREICYMCRMPTDLASMQVDHVIPESLQDDSRLAGILQPFGRPRDFQINSYSNWLPSCSQCNGSKRELVYDPAPIALIWLQRAVEKSDEAVDRERIAQQNRNTSRLMNALEGVLHKRGLTSEAASTINQLADLLADGLRAPELASQPLKVTPIFEVLSDSHGERLVRGPYGVGRLISNTSTAVGCEICGYAAFSGARCIACGDMGNF